MKGICLVCGVMEVKIIDFEELGSIYMGCWKMLMKGFFYCIEYKYVRENIKRLLLIYVFVILYLYIYKVIKKLYIYIYKVIKK